MIRRTFTLIELVVIVAIVVVVMALLLPSLDQPRRRGGMANSSQLRGFHTGMTIYAQGNNGYFPGLDSIGRPVDLTVESRLRILLEERYFTGEYAIAPGDRKEAWTSGPVHSGQYSYAMLTVAKPGERRNEWRETVNDQAVVLSDRAVLTPSGNLASIHTSPPRGTGDWRGSVGWNDGHVTYENTHLMPTRYGDVLTAQDHLFEADGTDDAYMIHSGK